MTDLYEQRIDAMKAAECNSLSFLITMAEQSGFQDARNRRRLAAYKRKRAALDGMKQAIHLALASAGFVKA